MSLEMQELIKAMQAQTAAINRMVESNQQVVALLTEVVASMADDGDEQPLLATYLDGTPRR